MTYEGNQGFADVKERLDEIVDAVNDDDISLDAALDLYEEAITLGMKVSSLLEEDISAEQIALTVQSMDEAEAIGASPVEGSNLEGSEAKGDAATAGTSADSVSTVAGTAETPSSIDGGEGAGATEAGDGRE